jgi:hypothetical protein
MTKTRRIGRGSMRRFPRFGLTTAGLDICDAYLRLATPDRRKVEDFLLNQAFLPNFIPGGFRYNKFNTIDRTASFARLRNISDDVADAWHTWALEISKIRPSQIASRDAMLALVCRMVFLKLRESVEPNIPRVG